MTPLDNYDRENGKKVLLHPMIKNVPSLYIIKNNQIKLPLLLYLLVSLEIKEKLKKIFLKIWIRYCMC